MHRCEGPFGSVAPSAVPLGDTMTLFLITQFPVPSHHDRCYFKASGLGPGQGG